MKLIKLLPQTSRYTVHLCLSAENGLSKLVICRNRLII